MKTFANLPAFSKINPATIENELKTMLDHHRKTLMKLAEQKVITWQNFMTPWENLGEALHHFWSPISHLKSVKNTEALRKAYNNCLPLLSEYATEVAHNKRLFSAVQSLRKSKAFTRFNKAQKQIIKNHLRDFKLNGVDLPEAKKKKFAEISKKLSTLSSQFEENVLDATQGWHFLVTDNSQLAGLPEHAIAAAKQKAEMEKKEGWLFTLEAPSYIAVMTYADSREFRQSMHRAYNTRASDKGPTAGKWDNSKVIVKILQLKTQLAKLLGFKSYAHLSLATKMVKKPQQVLSFLKQLAHYAKAKAKEEFSELKQFAKKHHQVEDLSPWDIAYYSEKFQQHLHGISQEDLRPYFPESQVLKGLFKITQKLYGVRIQLVTSFDSWHPDVKLFSIVNAKGVLRAQFYIDLYARKDKRGGAWMDDCCSRRQMNPQLLQVPVAYVNCNFDAPVGKDPALLTHDNVITLFHEFGHALQHMMTTISYPEVAGINGVAWDAVEVASQCQENWAWERACLPLIAKHYKTGKLLPKEMLDKMLAAQNFQSALQMVRQLEFSLFDFHLYLKTKIKKPQQVQKVLDEVRKKVSVIPVLKDNRFQNSFSHIFGGGYAAGYYSYKWAEMMSADIFSAFQEKGIFDKKTSQCYLHYILEPGGSEDFGILFKKFRGRNPKVDALLVQSGIKSDSKSKRR